MPVLVIEDADKAIKACARIGHTGNARRQRRCGRKFAANMSQAPLLIVAIPDAFEAGQVVQQAHLVNPSLEIMARAHSDAEVEHLRKMGAGMVIMGEREIASAIIAHVLKKDEDSPEAPLNA